MCTLGNLPQTGSVILFRNYTISSVHRLDLSGYTIHRTVVLSFARFYKKRIIKPINYAIKKGLRLVSNWALRVPRPARVHLSILTSSRIGLHHVVPGARRVATSKPACFAMNGISRSRACNIVPS
jgi:hypothetical protein